MGFLVSQAVYNAPVLSQFELFSYCGMIGNWGRLFLFVLLYAGFSFSLQAQRKVILAQDLVKMIAEAKGDTFRLEDVKIVRDEVSGYHFWPFVMFQAFPQKQVQGILENLDTTHVYKALDFRNVELDWDFTFLQFRFHKQVSFENCNNAGLNFIRCRLDSTLFMTSRSKTSSLSLRGCLVNGDLDVKNVKQVDLVGSRFYNRNYFSDEINAFEIKGCVFELRYGGGSDFKEGFLLSLRNLMPNVKVSMEIFECHFKQSPKGMGLDFFYGDFGYLNLQKSVFESPVIMYLAKFDRMIVEDCRFDKPLDMREISLPLNATNFPFWQLVGKIGVKDTFNSRYQLNETLYQAKTEKELPHKKNFDELIAVYSKLLGVYKYRGDQKSYNACYIEMKDLASRKADFDYRQNPSLEGLFEWRLAQFLKTFCDYGTSPVKSLIFSFYVIMAFAALYFLFPSEEDNLSRKSFSRFLTGAVDYFKTDKQLLDFQVEGQELDLKNLQFLRQKLEEARQGTPRIISWIGWPFYAWMSVYHRFMIWFYNRTDLVKGQWSLLGKGRKLWLGMLVSFYFLLFVLSGMFVRLLNALALSLNVFVTLGYGEISASGSMRYFAVLEGLLGWFLLSIFSVSLIGQVLQ